MLIPAMARTWAGWGHNRRDLLAVSLALLFPSSAKPCHACSLPAFWAGEACLSPSLQRLMLELQVISSPSHQATCSPFQA